MREAWQVIAQERNNLLKGGRTNKAKLSTDIVARRPLDNVRTPSMGNQLRSIIRSCLRDYLQFTQFI